ncbi:uncharacterized protein LOC127577480 [Pristis pectinata]|uniref:uncharacterized protein LOC127577480 n=1 Tax=Pristis pectinata TaxID=685728 RepID=UPI00223D2719|nr:uncharacterized protein LOC127577480 [Pristis pectinata]
MTLSSLSPLPSNSWTLPLISLAMLISNITVANNESLPTHLPVERAVACVVLSLACLIGIPGNLIVICTILFNITRRSSTIMLILTLAVADFVVLATLPFWIYSLAVAWIFGVFFWRLTLYLIFASMYTSVFLIMVMSLERLLGVLRPFAIQKWRKKARIRNVIICILVLSLLLAVPNMTLEIKFDAEGRPMHRVYSSGKQEIGLLLLTTLAGFLVPFITLIISYSFISKRIKQMSCQRKNRAGKLIASIVIAFVLCWLPFHAVNICRVTALLTENSNSGFSGRLNSTFLQLKEAAGALAFISSCVNPILYAFAARNFKTGFKAANLAKVFEQMNSSLKEKRDKESNDNELRSESIRGELQSVRMDLSDTEMDHSPVVKNAVVGIILSLASLLGIPGNILVIWIIVFNMQKQRSPTVVLILNLAVADVLVLITLPLWIYTFVHGWPFGRAFCKILTFIIHCNMYVSIFLITVMSGERFLAVIYPFTSQRWRKIMVVRVMVLLVWVLAFLFAIPVLMYQELDSDENGRPQCLYVNFGSDDEEILCVMIQFIVAFVIPFSMMSVFYICIGRKLKGMTFQRHTRTGTVIVTVVIVFFICWMPYHAVNLVSVIALMTKTNEAISNTLNNIYNYGILVAGALVFFNSCANPIIYALAARNIRNGFQVSAFGKFFDQMTHSLKEESKKESKGSSKQELSFTLEDCHSLQNS